jgi:SAM-dependent methyltransferase
VADLYAGLSRFYDSENAGLVEDLAAYSQLGARFGGPALDVGCGTGRVALHLAEDGLRVVGIDSSAAMLASAEDKLKRAHSEVAARCAWRQIDVRDLALDERFGLAIFAYSGFMHLLDQTDQLAALSRMAAHLRPGGGVALDLANPIPIWRADDVDSPVVERLFVDDQTGHRVMQQSLAVFDPVSQIMDITWLYDRIDHEGLVRRTLIPQRMRYTLASELTLLLQASGFGEIEIYGDYEFNAYDGDSPRLFAVARLAGQAA